MKNRNLVKERPLAKFYYQGNHSHPIRRTVLVIDETDDVITGYEVREGKEVRNINKLKNHIKSYNKDKIANWGDYSRLTQSAKRHLEFSRKSTLERFSIDAIFTEGI